MAMLDLPMVCVVTVTSFPTLLGSHSFAVMIKIRRQVASILKRKQPYVFLYVWTSVVLQ
jgi:hypothetical protein